MKKLIPALALLIISAVVMSTASYAWFSMNTQVTATGMQVKAQVEGGIVISNSTKSTWTAETYAQVSTSSLLPTSNAKAPNGNWYHNKSTNANDAAAGQDSGTYETLSPILLSSTTEGVGYIDANGDSAYTAGTDSAYYLMNRFFIKSSGDIITNTTLYINQVTVSSSVPTLEIDNALRVCVVVDGTPYLFAPVTVNAGPTLTYRVAGSTADTTALAGTTKNTATGVTTIKNTDDEAVPVQIYIYFEGEDANCKSTNISGIIVDTITVSVQFGTTTIS